MKKSSEHDHSGASPNRGRRGRKAGGSQGPWEFNTASGSLFALGATEEARRAAYRTATGEIRFLPL